MIRMNLIFTNELKIKSKIFNNKKKISSAQRIYKKFKNHFFVCIACFAHAYFGTISINI